MSVRSSSDLSSASATPTRSWEKNGSPNSVGSSLDTARTTDPTVLVARARAVALGMYPSSLAARATASRFGALTLRALFMARDATERETPARRATSSSVTTLSA